MEKKEPFQCPRSTELAWNRSLGSNLFIGDVYLILLCSSCIVRHAKARGKRKKKTRYLHNPLPIPIRYIYRHNFQNNRFVSQLEKHTPYSGPLCNPVCIQNQPMHSFDAMYTPPFLVLHAPAVLHVPWHLVAFCLTTPPLAGLP